MEQTVQQTMKRKYELWTPEEDETVTKAVKKHGTENWLLIAEIVRTKSDIQCKRRWIDCLDPNIKKGPWIPEEDQIIKEHVKENGPKKWSELATMLLGRTAKQCRERWIESLDPNIKKGSWTPEEDQIIKEHVKENGPTKWSEVATMLPGRTTKQCRRRWIERLDPNIKKGHWTEEEDELLLKLHNEYGNQWAKMSPYFNGRTDNSIKNRWTSSLSKRITRDYMGNIILKKGRKRKPMSKKQQNIIQQSQTQIPQPSIPVLPPQSPQDQQPQTTVMPKTTSRIDLEEQENLFPIFKQLADTNYIFDNTFEHLNPDYLDDFQPEDPTFGLEPTIDTPMLDDPIQEFSTIDVVSSKDPTKNSSSSNDNHGLSFV